MNLLISGAITTDSRLMFRRVVPDRIQHVAPFIQLDADPYIAIIDGRLKWIVDGYTSTANLPYSQRIDFGNTSGNSVTVSWTPNVGHLEASPALVGPGVNWQPVAGGTDPGYVLDEPALDRLRH